MTASALSMITRFASKGVFLDSNLVLLLLIGSVDRTLVGKHKRLEKYTTNDFDLLKAIISPVKRLFTTPHIATEVSNLAGNLSSDERFLKVLRSFLQHSSESHCTAARIVTEKRWERLGLTDTALCLLARRRLVVTDDLGLALSLEKGGENVINFNQLRSFA